MDSQQPNFFDQSDENDNLQPGEYQAAAENSPSSEEEILNVPPTSGATRPDSVVSSQLDNLPYQNSFGQYLKALRLQKNLSIESIAEETKIRSDYLVALEAEDFDSLPQPVYILGYVRKLCSLYQVDAQRANEITSGLRSQLEYEIPEDISKSVVDHEVSEENERRIRQLILIMVTAAALVVLVFIIGGVLLLVGLRKSPNPANHSTAFDESRLIELQGTPKLNITVLK